MMFKKTWVKATLALIFIFILYINTDVTEVIGIVKQVDCIYILLAVLVVFLIRLLMSFRWKLILDENAMPISFAESVYIILVSGSVGFLSPGGVAADFLKGHHAYKKENNLSKVTTVVLFDKLIGIVSMLVLISLFSTILLLSSYQGDQEILAIVSLVSCMMVIALFIGIAVLLKFEQSFKRMFGERIPKVKKVFNMVLNVFKEIALNKALMSKVLILSLLMQLLRSLLFYFILRSLSIDIALINVIAYFPIVFMLMLLPITIGGIGVREGATFILFNQFGVDLEYSISSGLLFYGVQLSMAVLGVMVYFLFSGKYGDQKS